VRRAERVGEPEAEVTLVPLPGPVEIRGVEDDVGQLDRDRLLLLDLAGCLTATSAETSMVRPSTSKKRKP
jgi:hypothetical protein